MQRTDSENHIHIYNRALGKIQIFFPLCAKTHLIISKTNGLYVATKHDKWRKHGQSIRPEC